MDAPALCSATSDSKLLDSALIDSCSRLQVDGLPVSVGDAGANLGCGLAFLVLLIRVVKLLQARGAACSVRVFIAAVQTVVAHAVAIAVAGLLVEHGRNLRRQLIGMSLVGILRVRSPEIGLGEYRWEFGPVRRRPGVVSGDAAFILLSGPLRRPGQGHRQQKNQA